MRLRIAPAALTAFAAAIFRAAGSSAMEASTVAEHLVEANLVGHDSHGAIRIAKYVDWVRRGELVPNASAAVALDKGALALVDGAFGYGQVVGRLAMNEAAARARAHGFALVAIRNSGHLGRIGAWAEQLAEAGLVSVHFVNTSGYGILVAPHGGSDRRLSANPVAAGAPRPGRAPLILDIATSMIAEGKIQVARNKGEALPAGAALDWRGRPTIDPAAFYGPPPGAILPFGGHKGSGLSFFCEILAGALTGGLASNPESATAGRLVNNMLSLVVDPGAFWARDAFAEDLARLVDWTTGSPPLEPGGEVLLPGELEARTRAERTAQGVPFDPESWRSIVATAESLAVSAPATRTEE